MSTPHANGPILLALQRGVPLTRRPFAAMAAALASTEAEILQVAEKLFQDGIARRFGAVFDSRRLGYASTLCGVDVPPDDLERVAALLTPHPGVTHCYQREGHPNLWFTMTAPATRLAGELAACANALAPYPLLDLPAIRRFKVQVVLDAGGTGGAAATTAPRPRDEDDPAVPEWPAHEKAVVRKLQGNLPLTVEPFVQVANELEWDPADLLDRLATWQARGVLRRVGVILRHRKAGFLANGMCVWHIDEAQAEQAGTRLAACAAVTHCYQRPLRNGFPYNLFAMVHAATREQAEQTFHAISRHAGLAGGRMLTSVREFKKSSPVFFCEEEGA